MPERRTFYISWSILLIRCCIAFLINYPLAIEKSTTQNQNKASKKQLSSEPTQISLSHSVQKTDKKNDSLKPIFQFLDTKNAVLQKYGSFEMAEQAIRELLVELEKS